MENGGGVLGKVIRIALSPMGYAYGTAMSLRRLAYAKGWSKSEKPDVPVICIGNLTMGGTGKTPFVCLAVRECARLGRRPGILLRGYRSKTGGISDEAELYRRFFPDYPIEVGADRLASAARAIKAGAEVLILDDGFQHLRIRRDCDIVLIDASRPLGRVLPAGPLREPASALSAAGAVILTHSDRTPNNESLEQLARTVRHYNPGVPIFHSRHAPVRLREAGKSEEMDIGLLSRMKVVALCAIARPDSFVRTLIDCGAEVAGKLFFPDHHPIGDGVVQGLEMARKMGARLVVTEKDAVKPAFSRPGAGEILVLGVEQNVDDINQLRMLFSSILGISP